MSIKPNFFILMAEDICPNWGCYGDRNAKTPYLDQFAKDEIRFNNCYSAAPVCSAARSSFNIGMFGSSAGVGQHRSMNELPEYVKNIGYYMQEEGYFTAIGKTDFNYPLTEGYDVRMKFDREDTAEFANDIMRVWSQAPEGKPFFIIQTKATTHQSQYGYTQDTDEHRKTIARLTKEEWQDRDKLQIPGYHFDTSEAREIWGQYHEKMTAMDRMMGEVIDAIKQKGLYDNSVILIIGDNGHGIPGGKINLWDEGVHVPMLMHVPRELEDQLDLKRDEHGRYCDRPVTFVDFAATFLSIIGKEKPCHMQGKPFLGKFVTPIPSEVFSFGERCDEVFENSRSIHEKGKMYSCDFGMSPVKRMNAYQTTQSPWFDRSMIEKGYEYKIPNTDRRAFYRQMPRINEQLFDLNSDPSQLMNLSVDKENCSEVVRLRNKMFEYINEYHDGAMMPEPLAREYGIKTGKCIYDILRDDEIYPIDLLSGLWKDALDGKDLDPWIEKVSKLPAGKMAIIKFGMQQGKYMEQIKEYRHDPSEVVRAYAAYVLKDSDVLSQICSKTQNGVLLMFISDLLSGCISCSSRVCLDILVERFFHKKDIHMDMRFEQGLLSSICFLAVKLGVDIQKITEGAWSDDKTRKARLVVEAMDSCSH